MSVLLVYGFLPETFIPSFIHSLSGSVIHSRGYSFLPFSVVSDADCVLRPINLYLAVIMLMEGGRPTADKGQTASINTATNCTNQRRHRKFCFASERNRKLAGTSQSLRVMRS